MRRWSLSAICLLFAMAGPALAADWPEHPVTIGFLGGIVTMPFGGEAGEVADYNNQLEGIPYGDTLELAGTILIEGTWNFHERAGATFGFGYIRYFSAHADVDTQGGTCTLPDGSLIPCNQTLRFDLDDLQIWPVYVGARYYLTGLNQEEGGVYVRADVGAVIYQPTNFRIYQHPSAGRDVQEVDRTILRGDWWEGSVNLMADAGLGFSFFQGPVGVFGEVRYLYMGPPSAANLSSLPPGIANNDPAPIQTLMAMMGVGFLF